jgi:hypothetical protein
MCYHYTTGQINLRLPRPSGRGLLRLYFGFASVFSPKIPSTSEGILKWLLFILALKGKVFWPRMYKGSTLPCPTTGRRPKSKFKLQNTAFEFNFYWLKEELAPLAFSCSYASKTLFCRYSLNDCVIGWAMSLCSNWAPLALAVSRPVGLDTKGNCEPH